MKFSNLLTLDGNGFNNTKNCHEESPNVNGGLG